MADERPPQHDAERRRADAVLAAAFLAAALVVGALTWLVGNGSFGRTFGGAIALFLGLYGVAYVRGLLAPRARGPLEDRPQIPAPRPNDALVRPSARLMALVLVIVGAGSLAMAYVSFVQRGAALTLLWVVGSPLFLLGTTGLIDARVLRFLSDREHPRRAFPSAIISLVILLLGAVLGGVVMSFVCGRVR